MIWGSSEKASARTERADEGVVGVDGPGVSDEFAAGVGGRERRGESGLEFEDGFEAFLTENQRRMGMEG